MQLAHLVSSDTKSFLSYAILTTGYFILSMYDILLWSQFITLANDSRHTMSPL